MSTDLADALVIWANGWLAAAYWTWDSAALLLTIGIAILITVRYDREVRRTAGERVRRYGRGEIIIASRRSLYETLAVLAVWSLAASVTAPPIPFIGLLMWLAFLIALRLIPQEHNRYSKRQLGRRGRQQCGEREKWIALGHLGVVQLVVEFDHSLIIGHGRIIAGHIPIFL